MRRRKTSRGEGDEVEEEGKGLKRRVKIALVQGHKGARTTQRR